MEFLCDEWLVDVTADRTGKALLIAAALTLIERSLLTDRRASSLPPAGAAAARARRLQLIVGVIGDMPAASAWSSNEEERRKALMSHFILGMPYILWDNIPRGLQVSCPHIERSCTPAYYSDRRLGVSEIARASAATIHLFNGNNIGAKGDLASRSLNIRLSADRADPENRAFTHPNPIDWTSTTAATSWRRSTPSCSEIRSSRRRTTRMASTRFKMWWRPVESAVEHAAGLTGEVLDFQRLFTAQEEEDEESASLADVLEILLEKWPDGFTASEVAGLINNPSPDANEQVLRDYLLPGALSSYVFSARTTSRMLKKHLDGPVRSGERTLVLRSQENKHLKMRVYGVEIITTK